MHTYTHTYLPTCLPTYIHPSIHPPTHTHTHIYIYITNYDVPVLSHLLADSKPRATAMRQDVPFEPLAPTSLPEVPCGVAWQMWGFPPMGKPWGNPLINDLQLVGFPYDLLVYSRVTDGLTMTKCGLELFLGSLKAMTQYTQLGGFRTIGKSPWQQDNRSFHHRYCDLKTLNAAVIQLMKLRPGILVRFQWPDGKHDIEIFWDNYI